MKKERDEFASAVKLIGYVFVAVAVGLAGLFTIHTSFASAKSAIPIAHAEAPVSSLTFTHPDLHYSVQYPSDFEAHAIYPRAAQSPDETVLDESFKVPVSLLLGTNLVSDTRIIIESDAKPAGGCSALQFLEGVTSKDDAKVVSEGGVTYSFAKGEKEEGGNLYEEYVYALPNSSPCLAIHYFIHSISTDRFAKGTVREFDRTSLVGDFDSVRHSLKLR